MQEVERLKLALEKSYSAVYEWDVASDEVQWSGSLCPFMLMQGAGVPSTHKDFLALIHKHDQAKYQITLQHVLEKGGDYSKTYRLRQINGNMVMVQDQGTAFSKGGKMKCVGMITPHYLHKDVLDSSAAAAPEVLPSPQTGALSSYQKDAFVEMLAERIEEESQSGKESVVLLLSIDNLLMMGTWYTLELAEHMMQSIQTLLQTVVRHGDVVMRTGIDQFGMILTHHSLSEAELVIGRMIQSIMHYEHPSLGESIHLRSSVGSVVIPTFAMDAQDALHKSYLALNTVKTHDDLFHYDYQEARKEHLDSQQEISQLHYMQSAFEEKRIKLAYQPIIGCKDGKPKSYECLLRIHNEDGSLVSAGGLIPVAEKMGIIDMVDQYVMERVVEELKRYEDVTLSFNISNLTTNNQRWLKLCTRLLEDGDVASRIIVEITETSAHKDMRQTAYFVAALQGLGCKVALDDFGAGYTSFRQLKNLSVDIVKIDGSYVRGLEENTENKIFIRTLMDFTHSYGLETIAECIENGEVAKMVMDLGVDYMQGYYFGKPVIDPPWAAK